MDKPHFPHYWIIKGQQFKHCVALVEEINRDGTPRVIRLIKEDETVDLEDPKLARAAYDREKGCMVPQFVTMYVPTHVVEK